MRGSGSCLTERWDGNDVTRNQSQNTMSSVRSFRVHQKLSQALTPPQGRVGAPPSGEDMRELILAVIAAAILTACADFRDSVNSFGPYKDASEFYRIKERQAP